MSRISWVALEFRSNRHGETDRAWLDRVEGESGVLVTMKPRGRTNILREQVLASYDIHVFMIASGSHLHIRDRAAIIHRCIDEIAKKHKDESPPAWYTMRVSGGLVPMPVPTFDPLQTGSF